MSALRIEAGRLWEKVTTTTERALATGALRPIPTAFEFVEQGGVRFLVRVAANLEVKDRETRSEEPARRRNPFLPPDEDLFVDHVSDSHLCVLNKYNVVEHHLLIVTREYEDQESLLTERDLEATWACMAEYEGLVFYNAGTVAGASQPHRHLQMVPLPLAPSGPVTPVEPVMEAARFRGALGAAPGLPFRHVIAMPDPSWLRSPRKGARECRSLYLEMLRRAGLSDSDAPRFGEQPYNLLITRRWMLLVPRSRECVGLISLNSLAFAGALLARNDEELRTIRERGPMTLLRSTAME